jgi:hypothetical protein
MPRSRSVAVQRYGAVSVSSRERWLLPATASARTNPPDVENRNEQRRVAGALDGFAVAAGSSSRWLALLRLRRRLRFANSRAVRCPPSAARRDEVCEPARTVRCTPTTRRLRSRSAAPAPARRSRLAPAREVAVGRPAYRSTSRTVDASRWTPPTRPLRDTLPDPPLAIASPASTATPANRASKAVTVMVRAPSPTARSPAPGRFRRLGIS